MNNVNLIGRLTKAPELRYIPESQSAVATFTIAVDRTSKDKGADFIRITVFGKPAENCEKYLDKGRLVAIQGHIQTGSYKNKDGQTVYTTDVIAERVEFLEWGEKKQEYAEEGSQVRPIIPEGFQAVDDDDIPF